MGIRRSFHLRIERDLGNVGFAVVETTDDAVIIDWLQELLPGMVACKRRKAGTLILCGPSELLLAKAAFSDGSQLLRMMYPS